MMSKKNNLLLYLIILIITLSFSEAVFFLSKNPSQWTGQFWISLFSLIISEFITFGYLIYADITFKNNENPRPTKRSSVLLISLYDISVISSILFFWLYLKISLNSYLIIQFTLMWVLLITVVILFTFNKHAASKNKDQIKFVQLAENAAHALSIHLENTNNAGEFGSLIETVKSLQEKIKYSDPVSSPALLDTEKKIIFSIKELILKIRSSESNEELIVLVTEKVQRIIGEIDKRNRLLKILK